MVATSGGGIDVIFYCERTARLIIVAGGFWGGESITYGKSNRIFIDSDSGSFVIDISDIDSDIGFGRKSRGAVVGDFDTESDRLMFLKIEVSVVFDFKLTIIGDFEDI